MTTNLRLLIIGCPHSGTMFTSAVLRSAGVACGHEGIFTLWGQNHAASDLTAEVSWEAVFHLDLGAVPHHVVIAHQTRDPLAWLNSWTRMSAHAGVEAWALLEKHYPGIFARQSRDPVRTAMWLWVQMNRRCAGHTDLWHRVEDLHGERGVEILDDLCQAAGIALDLARVRDVLDATPRSLNHHPGLPSHVPQTWWTLPQGKEIEEFKELACAYGYSRTA